MCGIVGLISSNTTTVGEKLVKALKLLEYRGYDSVGLAVFKNGDLFLRKSVGTVERLVSRYPEIMSLTGKIGLGHTRWATHGRVSDENAHPITDCSGRVVIVHNGTIDNFRQMKEELKGHIFRTETDTEVIPHLVELFLDNGMEPLDAFINAIKRLRGEYAVACMIKGENRIFLARRHMPLIVGIGKFENYCASDITALLGFTNQFIYLHEDEIAALTPDGVRIWKLHKKLTPVRREINKVSWGLSMADRGRFPHFMIKEIFEQGDVARRLLTSYESYMRRVTDLLEGTIRSGGRIVFIAAGTSYHASLVGKYLLNDLLGYPSEVSIASEFLEWNYNSLNDDDLVIAVSQSGETADVLTPVRKVREKGVKVLSYVNVPGSTLSRESDEVFFISAGPEIGVAATKTYIAEVLSLLLSFLTLSENLSPDERTHEIKSWIKKIPNLLSSAAISSNIETKKLSSSLKKESSIYFMGRGINYPTALEGALKLKEISYIHAEGFPAGEYKHGPLALISKGTYAVVVSPIKKDLQDVMLSNIMELKSRGAYIILVCTKDSELPYTTKLEVGPRGLPEELSPLLQVVPLQLLAYHTAVSLSRDPDKPRNLAKSVTVK